MTYLLIYLTFGAITALVLLYHDYVIERLPKFSLADLFGILISIAIWPIIVFVLLSEYLPAIDFSPDRIILWRRKTVTESPAPDSPPSSNDPDI